MRDDLLVPSARELAGTLRRRWWLVTAVTAAILATAMVYLGGGGGVPAYHATAKVLAGVPGDGPREDTELERLTSDAVVSAATARLGKAPTVSVSQTGADIFAITGTGGPDIVKLVNGYADAFVEVRRNELRELYDNRAAALRDRMAEVQSIRKGDSDPVVADRQMEALSEALDEVAVDAATIGNSVRVFAPARSASVDGPRSKKVTTVASLILALLAGLIAPFVYELLRGRVNTESDIERLVPGLRVIAKTTRATDDPGAGADVGLLVRLAVQASQPGGSTCVTIAETGAGSPPMSVAAEVARQMGASLLLASAGASAPAGETAVSLEEVLAGAVTPQHAQLIAPGSDVVSLVRDARFAAMVTDLRELHRDLVVLAGVATSADGLAVAAATRAVVLTATAGRTKVRDLRRAVEQCAVVGSAVVGVVLFGVSRSEARSG